MSIWSYLFDNEYFQRSDINRLDERASDVEQKLWSAQAKSRNAQQQAAELRHEMGRMLLVIEALSRIVVEKKVCTREELAATLTAVDAEDGTVDGRVSPAKPAARGWCGSCEHQNRPQAAKCAYCGAAL